MLQLNEFSKAPLSVRISRWSPNMKAFFCSIDIDDSSFQYSLRGVAQNSMRIPEAFCGSCNCSSLWSHLFPTLRVFFVSFFFLHFDNWVIYRINGWHRSNLVFKRGTGGTVFKIPINRFFLVRNEIGDANFKVFEMLIFLLEFLFFFHSLNRLFCRRTLIFEWTPRTCIVDRRIYILRARIIELYNIRFHITM